MEKAGERNLVRVKTTKTTENMPRFRIMSDVDLEVRNYDSVNLSNYLNSDCSQKAAIYSRGTKESRDSW